MRDERERRDGLKADMFGTSNPDPRLSAFGPRPSRLSQASAIAPEVLMNNVGQRPRASDRQFD